MCKCGWEFVVHRRRQKARRTHGMLMFYIIAHMIQRRCKIPAHHLCDQFLQFCTWQEKRTQKCTDGCQLEDLTDPALYAVVLCTANQSSSIHWENSRSCLFFVILNVCLWISILINQTPFTKLLLPIRIKD